MFVQSSRRSEKSGNNAKRKKSSSARLKKIGSVPPTEVVSLPPTPTRLADRTTHLGPAVLSCHRLGMHQPETRALLLATQAESTRCIKLKVMVRSIQDTLTLPMAKASKCTCTYTKTHMCLTPALFTNATAQKLIPERLCSAIDTLAQGSFSSMVRAHDTRNVWSKSIFGGSGGNR